VLSNFSGVTTNAEELLESLRPDFYSVTTLR
jgi:hypothetical protein